MKKTAASVSQGPPAPGSPVWDGPAYDSKHPYAWKFGASVVELLAPQPGERILDLGCGTGHLTQQIAQSGAEVVGLDAAPGMIEQARKNYPDLQFVLGDGTDFHFPQPFDAVFSNAALHWIKKSAQAVACIAAALNPGGRFVAEFGGKGNITTIVSAISAAMDQLGYPAAAALNPWYFPSIGEYAALVEGHGLSVTFATLFDRPTPMGHGAKGMQHWLEMFGQSFLAALPPARRPEFIRRVEDLLRPALFRDGTWTVDYRRLRIVATK
ncbi:MAG: methyltransferase domain-containing protein [Chloroflexi bacterium]|nr:methyltransferase domain-containing protein [Chloroflexota bacterium]